MLAKINTDYNIEAVLKADDTEITCDKPVKVIFSCVGTDNATLLYKEVKYWYINTATVRTLARDVCDASDCDFVGGDGFVRAGSLMKSFTAIICMWRNLRETETRNDICCQLLKAIRGTKFGLQPPLPAVVRAVELMFGKQVW